MKETREELIKTLAIEKRVNKAEICLMKANSVPFSLPIGFDAASGLDISTGKAKMKINNIKYKM